MRCKGGTVSLEATIYKWKGVHNKDEETYVQILQSWEVKSIPNQNRGHYDWKKVNIPPVFRKGKNGYRPVDPHLYAMKCGEGPQRSHLQLYDGPADW